MDNLIFFCLQSLDVQCGKADLCYLLPAELSSAGSLQSSMRDLDSEVREIRVNLLMEIERRKPAEDAFNSMERQWESLREKLSAVGVILSSASAIVMEDGGLKSDIAEDVCHQVSVARFVADAVGRGVAKAEVEKEMESLVESKNFEIARLIDRLHYYETMNSEMSNRNQEAMGKLMLNFSTLLILSFLFAIVFFCSFFLL